MKKTMDENIVKNKTNKVSRDAILSGSEIYKFFRVGEGVVQVLKGINLEVNKGEFIILFGSSGCGKSTLLNVLLGLEIPSNGKVTLVGKDLYSYDEDGRSQIRKENVGLIYQQQNWVKSLNVLENVAFPLALRGIPKEEREASAMEFIKMVNMEHSITQPVTELSSGQQQKVSFARALITKPSILVADEPTGNLDSVSSSELMQMFRDYNDAGNTIIMITHDLQYLSFATRALHMSDGLITETYLRGDKELEKFKMLSKK